MAAVCFSDAAPSLERPVESPLFISNKSPVITPTRQIIAVGNGHGDREQSGTGRGLEKRSLLFFATEGDQVFLGADVD